MQVDISTCPCDNHDGASELAIPLAFLTHFLTSQFASRFNTYKCCKVGFREFLQRI